MKQRYKVLLLFLIISLIPLVMSVGWGVYTVKQAQDEGFSFLQAQITRAVSNNMSLYFQQKIENTSIRVVQEGASDISVEDQQFILTGLLAKDQGLVEASIVNRGGIEKSKMVRGAQAFIMSNTNFADQEFFHLNRGGEYFVDSIQTTAAGKTVLIASPILSSTDEYLGSLLARYNLTEVKNILDEVTQSGHGYAYVVDKAKNLLMTTHNVDGLKLNVGLGIFASDSKYQKFLLEGEDVYSGLQGSLVHGTIDKLPGVDWWLVVEWPVADLSDIIRVNLIQLAILTLIVLLVSAVVSLIYINRVNNQFNQVIEGVKIIDKGNLKFRIKAPTNDELEDLATAVNSLADKLERCQPEGEDKSKSGSAS
ncbi:TPA: hypothetical protein DF272_01420 [Candidatus Falkowbacteria bacterium]|nr:hypothetical protein [Candidatus Falkowbacteria bacterium]